MRFCLAVEGALNAGIAYPFAETVYDAPTRAHGYHSLVAIAQKAAAGGRVSRDAGRTALAHARTIHDSLLPVNGILATPRYSHEAVKFYGPMFFDSTAKGSQAPNDRDVLLDFTGCGLPATSLPASLTVRSISSVNCRRESLPINSTATTPECTLRAQLPDIDTLSRTLAAERLRRVKRCALTRQERPCRSIPGFSPRYRRGVDPGVRAPSRARTGTRGRRS